MSKHWTEALRKLNACPEAVEWASKYPTLQAAWDVCKRGDWMWWLLYHTGEGIIESPLFMPIAYDCRRVATEHRVELFFMPSAGPEVPESTRLQLEVAYADIIRKHCPRAPKLERR